jgi:spore coat polysaccharide biosynthesis predicted glycosyltransferase SpsG
MHPKLFIRADVTTAIGIGHIMRCIALAQAWQEKGGSVTFLSHCENEVLRQQILREGFGLISIDRPHPAPEDLKQAISLLQDSRSDGDNLWFVLDGYHFGPEYNQNLNAEQLIYSCEPYTRLLLGTRYGLLRSEFLSWIDYKREIPEVAQKLLVTLGGADPSNQTLTIVRAIQQLELERLETIVLIGPANPYVQTLQSVIKQSKFPIQLISNPDNIPELMAWADLAISASGSTVMEMLFMGLPALVIILAENQKTVAEALAETDVAVNLGWYQDLSAAQIAREMTELVEATDVRSEMSQRGRHLVDGKGAERVLAKLLTA